MVTGEATSSGVAQRRRPAVSIPAMSGNGRYAVVCAVALLAVTLAGTRFAARGAISSPPDPGSSGATSTDTGSISTVVRDGDDTPGRLDIRLVRSTLNSATGHATRVRYTVQTLEPFRVSALHPRWRRLVLELDTDGQPGAERHVLISTREGRPSAQLISNATREVLDRLPVRRPRPGVLRVSGSRAQLGARKLFWTADWHRRGDPLCGVVDGWPLTCQDSVPDDGWVRLDRPAWP
jgi:hypothetical protein